MTTKEKEKAFMDKGSIAFIHDTSETSHRMFPNSILFEQTELADCFVEYPRFDDQGRVPFHFETIRQYQADDQALQAS